jgi:predicted pyridoxine 5'-phosphate oxidase superfamily flavin-nucleotide-binding protein
MPPFYSPAARSLQDQFDSRRLADRLEEVIVRDHFTPGDADFIGRQRHFFLATVDGAGFPQCSFKGGDPGFVRVVGERTLAFPCYDGNGMFLSFGNVAETGRVGMLFCDFEAGRRLRVNGRATIDHDDPLLQSFAGALFVVRVEAQAIFGNCPRYLPRYVLAEASPYVPRAGCEAPVPEWKTRPEFAPVLPSPTASSRNAQRKANSRKRS